MDRSMNTYNGNFIYNNWDMLSVCLLICECYFCLSTRLHLELAKNQAAGYFI